MSMRLALPLVIALGLIAGPAAWAAETASAELTLKDHQFVPQTLRVPAGTQIKLTVNNLDATPAEFESHDFAAEKVVAGHGHITLYIEPLKAGSYRFFDDFHESTTKGKLIAN
jgi:plastocyanin